MQRYRFLAIYLRQIHYFLFAFLFFATQSQAQTCVHTLAGKVVCKNNQNELIGATLWITELNKGTQTDEKGNFILNNLCEGTYTLVCTHISCKEHSQKIVVSNQQARQEANQEIQPKIAIYLEENTQTLQAVEIEGKKVVNSELQVQASNSLTNKELDATRGLSLGESLKKIVGVASLNTGSSISKPIIQGMHSNRVLVMNNGVRQEGQQWGAEHAPEIDPFVASELSVVKGAASVRYGADAIGGVVLVEPKSLRRNSRFGGELNFVGFSNGQQGVASGILEGNFARKKQTVIAENLQTSNQSSKFRQIVQHFYWRVQGTFKKSGTVHTPNYYLRNTALEEQNFSYHLGWLKEKVGIEVFYSQFNTSLGVFSGSHFGNLTDLNYIIAKGEPEEINKGGFSYVIGRPYQRIEHELFKLKSYWTNDKIGKFSWTYARQFNYRGEYDSHLPLGSSAAENTAPQMAFKITTHSTEFLWEHKPVGNFYGTMGMNLMAQSNTYSGRYFIPFFRNYQAGVFWIEHWEKNKWLLEAGIRYDFKYLEVDLTENRQPQNYEFPTFNFSNISASAGAKYTLNNHFNAALQAGMAWRPPSVNELFSNGVHHGAASFEIGDRNLQTERAYNFSLNLRYESKKVNLQLNIYNNYIQNYIYLNPEQPPTLSIRGAFPTFRYRQADVVIRGVDLSGQWTIIPRLKYQPKIALLRAYNYAIEDYLILMPPDRYENTLLYEMPESKVFTDNFASIQVVSVANQWRVPQNSDYSAPPAGYTLLNFEAGTTVKVWKQPIQMLLGVNNALNTVYRDYLNRFRYFSDELGRNFMLRVKVVF
jgi:iron complex outermembrane receptor protein